MSVYSEKKHISSLEDFCVRCICKKWREITYVVYVEDEPRRRWIVPYPGFVIPAQQAQKILFQMCKRKILTDELMYLFTREFVDLMSPCLRESKIGPTSLRVLREFDLRNLACINMEKLNLNSIIGCLGEQSLRGLISLSISGTSILSENKVPIVVCLGWFKNLQVLNVSRTEVTTASLQIVVKDLPQLRHLDISRTRVTDISALLDIRDRLQTLVMHRLEPEYQNQIEALITNVCQLHELRVLDVSDKIRLNCQRFPQVDHFISADSLPHLVRADLSGNLFSLTVAQCKQFVENHPHLTFCGFAAGFGYQEHDLDELHRLALAHPHITMIGDRGDELLRNTLLHCRDRAVYLQNAFQCIFEATNNLEVHKPDLLAAVLSVMRVHIRRVELMLAGTAVVYNLTRSDLSNRMPPELLNRAVRVTLSAMEKFPDNHQLHKNCFLTLCSDTVLHGAKFSGKQCSELVFNGLMKFEDVHMNRMGVAIISILAADIATEDLRVLASDRSRVRCLLSFVAEKCLLFGDLVEMGTVQPKYLGHVRLRREGRPVFDTTLRFTLSALWNLTDECSEACQGFVNEAGLRIYEKVLKRFADQADDVKNHVYTKCLGLLNNVAEVSETSRYLMTEPLMGFFLKMLQHPSIQISYFAAGIIAHLACLDEGVWKAELDGCVSRAQCVRLLGQAVCRWRQPQSEMVAYRSFRPFESLILHRDSCLEIQLWAVWAIHHILTRKESRYVPVLRDCHRLRDFLARLLLLEDRALCCQSSGSGDGPQKEELESGPKEETLGFPNPQAEKVLWVAEGAAASTGPTEDQLACASLIRDLAKEILDTEGRMGELQAIQ